MQLSWSCGAHVVLLVRMISTDIAIQLSHCNALVATLCQQSSTCCCAAVRSNSNSADQLLLPFLTLQRYTVHVDQPARYSRSRRASSILSLPVVGVAPFADPGVLQQCQFKTTQLLSACPDQHFPAIRPQRCVIGLPRRLDIEIGRPAIELLCDADKDTSRQAPDVEGATAVLPSEEVQSAFKPAQMGH